MAIPHAALQRLGCESSIAVATSEADLRRAPAQLKGADVAVVGKVLYTEATLPRLGPQLLSVIEKARAGGTRVIADFCDDNFAHPQKGPFDIALANSVDAVAASTPGLAETLRDFTPVPIHLITDPVEGGRREPRVRAQRDAPLALLWFGHAANFHTLHLGLRELERVAAECPFSLVVVTSQGPEKMAAVAAWHAAWNSSGRTCTFRPWSVRAVFDALQECDAVIVPSDPRDPAKRVKSPNRFAESLWAGRLVLAHPLPAYLPLAAGGWVGEDLADGLRWLVLHPEEALARIRVGQAIVEKDYSPATIADAWQRVIQGTTAAR